MSSPHSEKLAAFLRPVAEIRPGERFKTAVMFFYFFLTISLIYILKPVRGALFLAELGAKNLRYVYLGEGLFLIFVAAAYVYLARKLPRKLFFTLTLLFFASNLVLFWFLFHLKVPYLSAYFYIWVASFSITSTTQFWILANDIFDPSEAKRLFGLIISGGSAGGIVGGILTNRAMQWLKAEDMLWVAAGVLVLCAFLIRIFWEEIYDKKLVSVSHEKQTDTRSAIRLFLGSSYLIKLALLVMIAKIASTIIDNQFNRIVELTITGKEARAAFFGGFFAWLNVISFAMQLLATSFCFRFLGVGLSLWILPVGLMLFSMGTLAYPFLGAALVLKVFDGSINYSIQQASKEVLFLPVSSQIRYRVKPIIDMLGFRLAKSLGGFTIMLLAPLLGLSDERLGILVLFLIPFWFLLVFHMRRAYSVMLRQHVLVHPRIEKETEPKSLDILRIFQDRQSLESVRDWMENESAYVRKVAASAALLETHVPTVREYGWEDFAKRIRTEWEERVREKTDSEISGNRHQIREKLFKEIRLRRDVLKLHGFHIGKATQHSKNLQAFTRAFLDENLERIFMFLEGLYPHEAIRDIYWSFSVPAQDNLARAHAMELLMNTLDPDLLAVLPAVLDPKPVKCTDKEIREILESLMLSLDWWSVLIGFLVCKEYADLTVVRSVTEEELFARMRAPCVRNSLYKFSKQPMIDR